VSRVNVLLVLMYLSVHVSLTLIRNANGKIFLTYQNKPQRFILQRLTFERPESRQNEGC